MPGQPEGNGDGATIELTRFRVMPSRTSEFLAARPRMLTDFRADRSGFLQAQLIRLPDDQWLDIVTWRSREDFAESRRKGPNLPGIKAFFDTIDQLVSNEQGTLMTPGMDREQAERANASTSQPEPRRRRQASR